MPVVGVHDVGRETEGRHGLEGGPREESEAFEVVAVFSAAFAVEARAIEITVVLDEVERGGGKGTGSMKHPNAPAARHGNLAGRSERNLAAAHRLIERQENRHTMAERGERAG